jgi:hypothetical protein
MQNALKPRSRSYDWFQKLVGHPRRFWHQQDALPYCGEWVDLSTRGGIFVDMSPWHLFLQTRTIIRSPYLGSFQLHSRIIFFWLSHCQSTANYSSALILLLIVTTINLLKCVVMSYAVFGVWFSPLMTTTDVIASFLEQPDTQIEKMCLNLKEDFLEGIHTQTCN